MEMDLEKRAGMGVDFLRTNYGTRKVSLARATITDRGKTTQVFHEGSGRLRPWSGGLEGLVRSMIKKSDKGVEIFYAPTPMSGDKGRKKEQALPNVVVFGDADEGLVPDVKARLQELGACLVLSGGVTPTNGPKYHVYLLLTEEVPPAQLESLNRGLKKFIRGDKFDATTLLRIPGTRNHKYPGSPIVRVERQADAHHTPENLAKFLAVNMAEGTEQFGVVQSEDLPQIPEGFNYFTHGRIPGKMRKIVREWNQRFDDPFSETRRYMAAIAIVKDAVELGVSMDEAYGYASRCEPLLDKQAEENGYNIQKDIAKIWRRETGMKPSGTLTAEDILSARQAPDAKKKTTQDSPRANTTPLVPSEPGAMPRLGKAFPFRTPNLDELLSGDYKPLEPSLVPCGPYFLLYPGKSHGISSDRGLGKTNVTIAMVHEIMKQGGRVVYFDYEDSPDTFIRDRMMNQHGVTEEMIRTQFLYFNGVDIAEEMDMDDDSPDSLSKAIEVLADGITGWDLVIIDGVTNAMSDWSVEPDTDHTKPGNFLDGNKAMDYLWWHKRHIKPFLDRGIATFQIDHTNKTGGNRVGGTGQKGAKFTGIEYELRAEKTGTLVMGGTGKLLLSVAKDRIGRVLRHKRKRSQEDGDEFDVARFIMTSDIDGHIQRVVFEPVESGEGNTADQPAPLSDRDKETINLLANQGQPITKYALKKIMGGNGSAAQKIIDDLLQRGLIGLDDSKKLVPVSGTILDFSKADRVPKGAKRKRECHNCGDLHTYPDDFIQADEIGYQIGRRLCTHCAGENISREPVDGPEWARGVRERKERRSPRRGRNESS